MDWNRIFLHDLDGSFALEILFRTVFMFLVVVAILRLSGKRGVRQLSIFELAIILTLGSAAGDAMFYDDVALFATLLVCVTAISLYRLITWLAAKSRRFEKLVEGKAVYIVEDSVMTIKDDEKESLSKEEFFAELREKGVEHLGQVRAAILETGGNLSVFFYANEDVKYGLPILPHAYDKHTDTVKDEGLYACVVCGTLERLAAGRHRCPRCKHHEWVKAINTKRVS
ncbi:DUF421 domain-containing protein [Parapedobacter sp. 10938]|uniref:DUF421 domain-containing protein n=1 Tax=Parapedobacter flavus TaxID=3110225 RepID=UPI002DB99B42|nr:YetF domain-containing protein [Parapedobacter sp. 10938]MEC3881676.1 YetF domain-containing protein [Parapedobacter sp. 10938]